MSRWYSYLYPIKYMRAWLADDFGMDQRKIPLQFSIYCAMCGSLGIGIDLNAVSDEKLEELNRYIAVYKDIREVVQLGDIYRLQTFHNGDIHAVQYVKESRSAVFVFLDHKRYGDSCHTIQLRGLKEDKKYRYMLDQKDQVRSGAFLMNIGIQLLLQGDYDSMLIQLEEIE